MNKIIIVTGGTSGIGLDTVNKFKELKDTVYVLARNIENKNDYTFECDVSNEEMVKNVVQIIAEKEKHIDVLVNCAGYGISGALELIPSTEAEKQFDVNVLGAYYMSKYALKYMRKGSTIINIASACALFPLPYRTLYCSSKSALNMLSMGMRMECKPFGVNVVSLCPGDVKTNFTKNRVKIFKTNERYGKRIENAAYYVDKNQEKRMPATKVSEKIVKVAQQKNPKPMIIIGGKYKVLYFFSKILPTSWLLYFTEKFFGGHKEK